MDSSQGALLSHQYTNSLTLLCITPGKDEIRQDIKSKFYEALDDKERVKGREASIYLVPT